MSFIGMASAWTFNGTIHDVNSNFLNGTLVNITIWQMGGGPPILNSSVSTKSNLSGWFNLTISENANWMYKPIVTFTNLSTLTTNSIDYMGSLCRNFHIEKLLTPQISSFI